MRLTPLTSASRGILLEGRRLPVAQYQTVTFELVTPVITSSKNNRFLSSFERESQISPKVLALLQIISLLCAIIKIGVNEAALLIGEVSDDKYQQ